MSTISEPKTPQLTPDAAESAIYHDPAATFMRDGRKHNIGLIEVSGELGGGKAFAMKASFLRLYEEALARQSLDPLRLFPVSGQGASALQSLVPGFRRTAVSQYASLAALLKGLSA